LGVPPPKGKKICPGPMCTIVQNFTPIGVTVAEVSVSLVVARSLSGSRASDLRSRSREFEARPVPPGSLDPGIINFLIPNPGIEKRLRDCNPYVHRLRLDLI